MLTREILEIAPEWSDSLRLLGLEDFNDFRHPKVGSLIAEVRDRRVYRLPKEETGLPVGFYLKVFENFGANRPIQQLLSRETPCSCARTEWNRLFWLRSRGYPAPKPAAMGESMKGPWEAASFLLTEELHGFTALDEWLDRFGETASSAADRRFIRREKLASAARLLRDLHAEGFDHPYPYLRHFFIKEDEEGEAAIIDVHSAVIRRTVNARRRGRALAELFISSLRVPLTASDRLYFFKVYCDGQADKKLAEKTFKRVRNKMRRHPNRYAWAGDQIRMLRFPSSIVRLVE